MKVLIVEDETAAFDNLVSILASIDPMIEIMGNTEGVAQTVRWLKNNPKPDLIFMDIHLSDGSLGTSRELMRRLKVQGLLRTDDHKGNVQIINSSGRQELIDLSQKLLNLPDYE